MYQHRVFVLRSTKSVESNLMFNLYLYDRISVEFN